MNQSLTQQLNNSNTGERDYVNKIAGINNDTAKENAKSFFTLSNAKAVAQLFSTQIINKAVSSIGSRTGNYVLQERVQGSVKIVTKIASLGYTFATNPVLGAITLVSDGIGLAFDAAQRNREIAWRNRTASELARRAGYLSDQNR